MRKFYVYVVVSLLFLLVSCGARRQSAVLSNPNMARVDQGVTDHNAKSVVGYYAQLLDSSPKQMNADLYAFIDQWMGSPHRMGGLTKSGIDCSAFINLIYQEIYDKSLPRVSRDMAQAVRRKYENKLKEGDLVFFSFGGKSVDHVGLYLHNGKFVHVSTKQGVVISNLKDPWYYKYFTRCGSPI